MAIRITGHPSPEHLLLGGTYLPLTEPAWFVNAAFETVAAETRTWLSSLPGGFTFTELSEPLPRMLDRLEPVTSIHMRYLLVATATDWTAVFSQGEDAPGVGQIIGSRLDVLHVRTHYSPHVTSGREILRYGDCAFWLHHGAAHVRSVQASMQDRWQWHAFGDVQDFEDVTAYGHRRIADRLTVPMINDYCRALGIRREDASFYRPQGLLMERDAAGWPEPAWRKCSAQWRAEHGL